MSSTIEIKEPTIVQRRVVVGDDDEDDTVQSSEQDEGQLVLIMLGCEAKPPYGPYIHTATLFLDLICLALKKIQENESSSNRIVQKVIIKVYETSNNHFPLSKDYKSCHGVILPGSFNSAYEQEPWIMKLKDVIQTELVANQVPTLGVCFGHQLYAHSFHPEGGAIKCPAGHQAGRIISTLTKDGQTYLAGNNKNVYDDENNDRGDDPFQLFYTHGDMVEKLPKSGINLGGTDNVPIQAALYYAPDPDAGASTHHKHDNESQQQEQPKRQRVLSESSKKRQIIAVTFQAHPEYGTSKELGLDRTLKQILEAMEERGGLTPDQKQRAMADAEKEFEHVQKKSIQTMIQVGKLLGWFL